MKGKPEAQTKEEGGSAKRHQKWSRKFSLDTTKRGCEGASLTGYGRGKAYDVRTRPGRGNDMIEREIDLSHKLLVLMRAIRCVLKSLEKETDTKTALVRSVLIEAVKQTERR